MKNRITAVLFLLFLMTSCATQQRTAQDVVMSKSTVSESQSDVFNRKTFEEDVHFGEFIYGDIIQISGISSITPTRMAKEQARSQAYTKLAMILRGIVQSKAGSIIGNYSNSTEQLSDRIFANMASFSVDKASVITQSEDQNGAITFTLAFDTRLVPDIYEQALSAVSSDIEEEKKRLKEVTEQAILSLKEAEQLTKELEEYANERLATQNQLLDEAFAGLESDKVIGKLNEFRTRITI
jgi:hypothetical protein